MIHPTAVIHDKAHVAKDVKIGPFCHIGEGVSIASGCELQSNVIIRGKISLAEKVKIFSFTNIGNGSNTITIGSETVIREFCQIASDEENNAPVDIGFSNFIMAYVNLKAGVTLKERCILTNAVTLNENVNCHDKVIIGGLSTIEAGNTIGTGVMIGGASYVTHDLPPFCLVEGNRASVKGLNLVGLRRRMNNPEAIDEIRLVFKEIFRSESVNKQVAQKIADTHTNEYAVQLAAFVATSNI